MTDPEEIDLDELPADPPKMSKAEAGRLGGMVTHKPISDELRGVPEAKALVNRLLEDKHEWPDEVREILMHYPVLAELLAERILENDTVDRSIRHKLPAFAGSDKATGHVARV